MEEDTLYLSIRWRATSVVARVTWTPSEMRRFANLSMGFMWPCKAMDTIRTWTFSSADIVFVCEAKKLRVN